MVRDIIPPPPPPPPAAWKDEEGEPAATGDDDDDDGEEAVWRGGRKPAIIGEEGGWWGATRGAEEPENGARTGCSSWPGTSPSKSSRSVVDADPARWRAGTGAVGIVVGWCWFGRCRAPVV